MFLTLVHRFNIFFSTLFLLSIVEVHLNNKLWFHDSFICENSILNLLKR